MSLKTPTAKQAASEILALRPGTLAGKVWEETVEDATQRLEDRDRAMREAGRREGIILACEYLGYDRKYLPLDPDEVLATDDQEGS